MAELEKIQKNEICLTSEGTFSGKGVVLNWDGVAPSNINIEDFEYHKNGDNLVFYFRLRYDNPGAANTELYFRLPCDDDSAILPDYGYQSGVAEIVAIGSAVFLETIDGLPIQCNCYIKKSATEEYTIFVKGAASNVKSVIGRINYHSNLE